jgi:hypothetical protein
MAHLDYLGGLKREFHHIRKAGDEDHGYEPAMVILKHELPRRSFIIPLEAFWKYVDPKWNQDADSVDLDEFEKLRESIAFRFRTSVLWADRKRAEADLACVILADAFSRGTKILRCTAYNLFKCMQMMDITPTPQAAAQLLLWIQDGLDELRNFPEHPGDEVVGVAGEVELWEGSTKIVTKEIKVTESEMMEEEL